MAVESDPIIHRKEDYGKSLHLLIKLIVGTKSSFLKVRLWFRV